jgi:glycosyltransferase involved in cell wall biosynthesis
MIELTILMPCLNEAETLATCVRKARAYLDATGIKGEILVADNGSTDGSQAIAEGLGAVVVPVPTRGYGAALGAGIAAARGRYVIMGDSDDSYDFSRLDGFVERLRDGADLVMGNRFKGGIAPGAMPPLHRYLGNPVLSTIGRVLYRTPVGDFHCGLRGFSRAAILRLGLTTPGMEFASEMVIRASLAGLKIVEVPTTLSPDGRSRPPHLRSWRDGWRHLKLLLTFAPFSLFLYPGFALLGLGMLLFLPLLFAPLSLGRVTLDTGAMIFAADGSIAVVVRLERPFDLDADIVGLTSSAQLGQLHADLLQVQAGDLFIQRLRQDVDAGRVVLALGPKLDLRQHLVGKAGRHHEGRVAGGVAKVQQAAFGQKDDAVARGHLDHVHLFLDVGPLVVAQRGDLDLVVEMADVADDGHVLHRAHDARCGSRPCCRWW